MFTIIFWLIIIVAGVKIITNWRKKVKVNSNQAYTPSVYTSSSYPNSSVETYYESHCWKCQRGLDSRDNSKCYKCKRFYCKSCGNCLCGKGYNSKPTYDSKKWVAQSSYNGYSAKKPSYTYSNPSYGYCKRCSKKLSGDRSKPLCYSCWKER